MDQRTSPTCCRSCRQYLNNLPDHQKTEILSRREWTTSTSLINLPRTGRLGGHHYHLFDNKGNDEADDTDVGEDSNDEEDNDYYWANFMQDIPCYDSDGHLIIEDFVPSDQVDEEDEEDEEDKEDEDDKDDEDDIDI